MGACAPADKTLVTAAALNTSRSDALFAAAQKLMPGGVNSPVRAFRSVGGQPIVFDRVEGAYAWDVDGNRYIDYIGSWGPAICGHAHPEVLEALQQALSKGTSFGAPCALENTLAEMGSTLSPAWRWCALSTAARRPAWPCCA